jgi:O-antigen ligase
MNHKPGLVQSFLFLICSLCAINIFLSFERSSWLGGIFVVLGLLVIYPKPMLRFGIPFIVIMMILSATVFSNQIAFAYTRIQEERTINERLVIYDALLQMIERKPIFGWGYDTVDRYSSQFFRQVGNTPILYKYITSHNTYLTIMAELGLVGFLLYIFPLIYWLIKSFQAWPRLPATGPLNRLLLIVLWLVVLHMFIVSNFMDMRFFPLSLGLWWLTLGLIANFVSPYIKSDNMRPIIAIEGHPL